MITDAVLRIFFDLFKKLIDGLPDMDARPVGFNNFISYIQMVNHVFPLDQMALCLAALAVGFTGFYIWRIIRLFFPGG